jgi:hypothetical protein
MVCGDFEKARRKDHELEGLGANFSIFNWFSMKLHILSYNVKGFNNLDEGFTSFGFTFWG